jgi:hypothetical protein
MTPDRARGGEDPQADGAERAGGGLVGQELLAGQLGGPIGAHRRCLVLFINRLAGWPVLGP